MLLYVLCVLEMFCIFHIDSDQDNMILMSGHDTLVGFDNFAIVGLSLVIYY